MTTTTGGISGPTGAYGGWGSPKKRAFSLSDGSGTHKIRKEAPRDALSPLPGRAEPPSEPQNEPPVVEPAPQPKKRAKQLIVGEKVPFAERLERHLKSHLEGLENIGDFPVIQKMTGSTEAGVGPKAKAIQQRVETDNSQRGQSVPPVDVDPEKEKEEET